MLGIDDSVADDRLRAKAKARLEQMLDSADESKRLAAARALYSYQAQKPPNEPASISDGPPPSGRGVSFAKLLAVFVFEAEGAVDQELADVILRSAKKVRELQAAGEVEPTFVDQELEAGVERFTSEVERLASRARDERLAARTRDDDVIEHIADEVFAPSEAEWSEFVGGEAA
jgi:hypothetical protein